MVDLIERLNILLMQDRTHYRAEDYLNLSFQQKLLQANDLASIPAVVSSSSTSSSSSSSTSNGINESWREKICEWSYQVVDHFDFSREVVSISISFLDRYLSVRTVDKRLFQLAAMTTLYMTIKIYERGTLSMASMIDLSRGFFMIEHMAAMEWSLFE
jgi:lipoyl(octanoyl) transferase